MRARAIRFAMVVVLCALGVPSTVAATPPGEEPPPPKSTGGEPLLVETPSTLEFSDQVIRFDASGQPVFNDAEKRTLDKSFREGLALYARTREGRAMIARYGRGDKVEIRVTLAPGDPTTLGSTSPSPGNLGTYTTHGPVVYDVTINSAIQGLKLKGAKPLGYVYPTNTAILRALQIGAEILHVDFFVRGFHAGTHHGNPEFQARWRAFARELGCRGFPHHD